MYKKGYHPHSCGKLRSEIIVKYSNRNFSHRRVWASIQKWEKIPCINHMCLFISGLCILNGRLVYILKNRSKTIEISILMRKPFYM